MKLSGFNLPKKITDRMFLLTSKHGQEFAGRQSHTLDTGVFLELEDGEAAEIVGVEDKSIIILPCVILKSGEVHVKAQNYSEYSQVVRSNTPVAVLKILTPLKN